MASSEETVPGKSATPVVKKLLKPIKTTLRAEDVRQCRLCMRVVPRADTHDTMTPGSDLRRKILDAVVVEIFPSDKVTTVCINCIMVVDIINDFRISCRKADTLHWTKLMMMHPGSWLSDENKSSLAACQRLVKHNRAKMDALYRCSGVNNEEIQRLIEREEKKVLEPERKPVANLERVDDVPVPSQPKDDEEEIKTEEIVGSGPEMSEQCVTEQDTQLQEAQRMAAKKEAKVYMCELCGKLVQKMYMEEHENMHIGKKPYKCPEDNCNRRFGSNVLMSIHIINVHKKGKRIECEICHKSIKSGPFFKQHLQTHQAINTLKVPCNVCGKMFYKRYLRDHVFVHTGETPYKCEFCDRKFAARNNLAVHRRKQHSDKLEKQG